MMNLKKTLENVLRKALSVIASILVLPPFGFGIWSIFIFIQQFIYWFDKGEWISVPASVAFYHYEFYPKQIEKWLPSPEPTNSFTMWLLDPKTALGPHKIIVGLLDSLSITAFTILTGLLYFAVLIWLVNEIGETINLLKHE